MSNQNITDSSLINEDLAPIPQEKRKWGTWNYAALWISMSLCIPSYQLASGMIAKGMNWWQAIMTMLLGNLIVLVPMILNGHAGAKYGIPFPVFVRASFGTKGANIPAMLRAIVACGWFGIQTWIGGKSLYRLLQVWIPDLPELTINGMFPDLLPLLCFLVFWLLNMYVIYLGVDSIKKLLVFKAFFLPVAAVALLCWAFWVMQDRGGIAQVFSVPSKFQDSASFYNYFIPALTGVVGFWATLSLNIPDFTRYAKSQKAQRRGQALGLPTSMTFIAIVAVVVSLATAFVFKDTIWEPEALVGRFDNKIIVSFALIAVIIATLATNIAANIVSPANDFSNLNPKKINFRMGGYITGIIGILIFPWKLVEDPTGYIYSWLVGYSALLGPVGGIMIADYYFIRKQKLETGELYSHTGRYGYGNGFNMIAIFALLTGILPNIPGFLLQVQVVSSTAFPVWISELYHFAWFVGFFLSGFVYWILMKNRRSVLL
ncbi:MAG: NCS1 family nucleobase:cation symporter-1 [Chitinophagaceae bacterium]|nr:NCS1 family nucleobase:cation symporter-1 [Chitinophagaceae bacterium]